jgi:hypothetical protein
LQPAVGAGALDERLRAAAGWAGFSREIDLAGAFLREHLAPVTAQDLGDLW